MRKEDGLTTFFFEKHRKTTGSTLEYLHQIWQRTRESTVEMGVGTLLFLRWLVLLEHVLLPLEYICNRFTASASISAPLPLRLHLWSTAFTPVPQATHCSWAVWESSVPLSKSNYVGFAERRVGCSGILLTGRLKALLATSRSTQFFASHGQSVTVFWHHLQFLSHGYSNMPCVVVHWPVFVLYMIDVVCRLIFLVSSSSRAFFKGSFSRSS